MSFVSCLLVIDELADWLVVSVSMSVSVSHTLKGTENR